MDIKTSPDPVARARALGTDISAAAGEIERTRRIPEALLGRLHDSRLFRMLLPRSAGGDETEPALYVAAVEELARHDASIAWNVFVAKPTPATPWPGALPTHHARARLMAAIS